MPIKKKKAKRPAGKKTGRRKKTGGRKKQSMILRFKLKGKYNVSIHWPVKGMVDARLKMSIVKKMLGDNWAYGFEACDKNGVLIKRLSK